MPVIRSCELPSDALLTRYLASGAYADCYATEVARPVSHAEFVEAFYTTAVFKLERLILRVFASRPSTDVEAGQLARGDLASFAAWSVEARSPNQLLLADYTGRTRSWLMVAIAPDNPQSSSAPGSSSVPRWSPCVTRRRVESPWVLFSARCLGFTNCTRAFSCWPPGPSCLAMLQAAPHERLAPLSGCIAGVHGRSLGLYRARPEHWLKQRASPTLQVPILQRTNGLGNGTDPREHFFGSKGAKVSTKSLFRILMAREPTKEAPSAVRSISTAMAQRNPFARQTAWKPE